MSFIFVKHDLPTSLQGHLTSLCGETVQQKCDLDFILLSSLFNEKHVTSIDNNQTLTIGCGHSKKEVKGEGVF